MTRLLLSRERMLRAGAVLEDILRESSMLGIPSIDPSDGVALMLEAYRQALQGGTAAADLGAGVGYSTAWIALGVDEGCVEPECRVLAVEYDPARAARIEANLARLGLERTRVEVYVGDAIEALRGLGEGSLSLAFVDIEKSLYTAALRLLQEKLRSGGAAFFHNAFFPSPPLEFFAEAGRGPWRSTVLPTPAGMLVAYKI